ncbi:subtilisin DY domain protein [Synechococcus sp. A18-46.1]|nr:subtilisin DY domain protein [Synechococcus sp. A18-46.1]
MTDSKTESSKLPDLSAPNLNSFRLLTDTIDISKGSSFLEIEAKISDNLSGIKYAFSFWNSPSGKQETFFSQLESGNALDGLYKSTFEFTEFHETGTWDLGWLHLRDEVGNTINYYPEDFERLGFKSKFEVIGNIPDLEAPKLNSFRLPSEIIDISKGNSFLEIEAKISDNLSGIKYAFSFWNSPSGKQETLFSQLESGNALDGLYKSTFEFTAFHETGIWDLGWLHLRDEAGNTINYYPEDFERLGFKSQFEVLNLELSPEPAPTPAPVPEPTPAPAPEPTPAPAPKPTPAPAPEPTPAPAPEPAPAPAPEPTPAPAPEPTPAPAPEPAHSPIQISRPDSIYYSEIDGYGQINAAVVFERLTGDRLNQQPSLGGDFWPLDQINIPETWEFSTGKDVTVAVVDTGIDLDHLEFKGRLTEGINIAYPGQEPNDINGHGTHVAGTIAAADDGQGSVGVAPESIIMPIKVLYDNGFGRMSAVISGIRWAAKKGADIINLSLGGYSGSAALEESLAFARSKGSLVVMAAGNSGGNSPIYPAAYASEDGIAVGAVDKNSNMTWYSNKAGHAKINYVTAPGSSIFSSIPGGYGKKSGTSMAAPHVAGVAALIKDYSQEINYDSWVNSLLGSSSNSITNNGGEDLIFKETRYDEQAYPHDIITGKTINEISNRYLRKPLIARLAGNKSSRKSTFNALLDEEGIVDEVDAITQSKFNFITLDMSNRKTLDISTFIESYLESGQIEYLELDAKVSIV